MKSNGTGWLRRLIVFLLSVFAAIVLIGVMRFALGPGLQEILLDADSPSWPLTCLLYTSPSPRDKRQSRMPSSA